MHIFNVGDIVVYTGEGQREKGWLLKKYHKYMIKSVVTCDVNHPSDYAYEVTTPTGDVCWFGVDDFITESEYRKIKLERLNENCTNI